MGGAQQILARLVAPIGHWNFFALFAYFAVKSFNRKSLNRKGREGFRKGRQERRLSAAS
jgi:hypothetical protein